jgi:hypothetical protein
VHHQWVLDMPQANAAVCTFKITVNRRLQLGDVNGRQ